ncbi:hypothetical protein FCR2A7T_04730 [Flavobacterium cauense R2A-7]|uniref:Glycosyltransferase involved in cell wall biosynthesis n=1 Tax=Flavobacterium cauense R2A-7 TaxID=1341154 RepID=V6S5S8_9FLAO|nr:glycosyltransferase [Flavobacterium cauense]ESU22006.1 hypothetical protein FCR2A7T_04730 [Flavobacterium cauense R2A-7]KGO81328.1 hypothetical protein Q762_08895 [Flavobacterium cauense R2A-7]TWI13222.1 glycosyltransferase involved in cell wall biosynthesis [Flavobacterium cauense R2A-7]
MPKSILHITEKINKESGGLRTVITNLNDYLNSATGFDSSIITFAMEDHDAFQLFDVSKPGAWLYSKSFKNYLNQLDTSNTILHLHGVWMYQQYISSKTAVKKNIPYLLSSHGMLEKYLLQQGRLKKTLYCKYILKDILKNANYLHAITPIESESLFRLSGGNKNIVEIPNLIHYSSIPQEVTYNPNEEYILYLGRFHSVKGLDILLEAYEKIDNKKIQLLLIGPHSELKESLENRIIEKGMQHKVFFKDFVSGIEKFNVFKNAKVFVAPSYSEVIGMVNLEAAACKVPVISTYNTGLHPNWNTSGGILIKPQLDALVSALNNAVNWDTTERIARGNQLADFVLQNYSWEKKGVLWEQLYNTL